MLDGEFCIFLNKFAENFTSDSEIKNILKNAYKNLQNLNSELQKTTEFLQKKSEIYENSMCEKTDAENWYKILDESFHPENTFFLEKSKETHKFEHKKQNSGFLNDSISEITCEKTNISGTSTPNLINSDRSHFVFLDG